MWCAAFYRSPLFSCIHEDESETQKGKFSSWEWETVTQLFVKHAYTGWFSQQWPYLVSCRKTSCFPWNNCVTTDYFLLMRLRLSQHPAILFWLFLLLSSCARIVVAILQWNRPEFNNVFRTFVQQCCWYGDRVSAGCVNTQLSAKTAVLNDIKTMLWL